MLKFWHEFAVETTHCVPGQEPGTNFSLQRKLDLEDTDIEDFTVGQLESALDGDCKKYGIRLSSWRLQNKF